MLRALILVVDWYFRAETDRIWDEIHFFSVRCLLGVEAPSSSCARPFRDSLYIIPSVAAASPSVSRRVRRARVLKLCGLPKKKTIQYVASSSVYILVHDIYINMWVSLISLRHVVVLDAEWLHAQPVAAYDQEFCRFKSMQQSFSDVPFCLNLFGPTHLFAKYMYAAAGCCCDK